MSPIVAIDPSLSHTAGWIARGEPLERSSFAIATKPKQHAHAVARLRHIRDAFLAQLDACGAPGLVVTEGYAFGAKCAREALGELGGALRLAAHERGWPVVVVQPTVLKAYVCGRGNAPKEQVILSVFKRWGYEASDNNDADARALLELAIEYAGPREGLSKERAKLLAKLEVLAP